MRRISGAGACVAAAVVLFVLAAPSGAEAGAVVQRYDFPEPRIEAAGAYHRVTMDGTWTSGIPGEPALPAAGATILLPPGEALQDVRVVPGERVVLGRGYVVEPARRQYPLSYRGPVERVDADYTGLGVYPERKHGDPAFGYFRGHGLASLALYPVEYDPATGEVSYYTSLEVEITTEATHDAMHSMRSMIRDDDGTMARIARIADNPSARLAYSEFTRIRPLRQILDPSRGYKYVIITTDSWDEYLEPFADFQTQRGHKAGVFLKSWITSVYAGPDEQAQIREFIIDAYNTWDIDYVLLAGDALDPDGIPHRGMWNIAYGVVEENIPCDLYYGGLDGTWNKDGDENWGESTPEEADLYPEVSVGRVCIDSAEGAQNFVAKTMRYADEPIASECREALMVGELLWSYPLTWGGDYMDELIGGSTANGYVTVGVRSPMNVNTLYDRDSANEDWPESEIKRLLTGGTNIVSHLGHCNVQDALKMTNDDIPDFTNDGTTHMSNFLYSQGCYAGSFDDRDPDWLYPGDCFGEEFVLDDGGAVAAVLNSRYGWGDPGGTNGSSQFFAREFFDALFGEGIHALGEVNDDSKMDSAWALSLSGVRWCYYELNVFGDPAMHPWTAEPASLTVGYPSTVMVGQPSFDVIVTDGAAPIEGAHVAVWSDGYAVYDAAVTSAIGVATLHPYPDSTGALNLKVTSHDFLTWNETVTVEDASGPYVVLDSLLIDDDLVGDSAGNANGSLDAGETIELAVTLENALEETAYGVTATLSTFSDRVTLIDDYDEFGDVAPHGTALGSDGYVFEIAPDMPDGEFVLFKLTVTDAARGTWESHFGLDVAAPVVSPGNVVVDDPLYGGDDSGCPEAGETVSVTLSLANGGGVAATGIVSVITTDDPYVVINDGVATLASLDPGADAPLSSSYSLTLLPVCPELHEIVFDVAVTADLGYVTSGRFSVLTGGPPFADDVESGEGEWTHCVVTPSFIDQWHVDTYRYHSEGHSWKFGGPGATPYADSSDGALVMRPMCVGVNGRFSFWHWMDAEEGFSGSDAWDCGFVEITTDGGVSWNILHPDDGYTHVKNYNPANPLPEGTPCWSGSFDWREETFDLSPHAGETVQIRLRFVSDGYITREGWYVDDFALTFDGGSTTGAEQGVAPHAFALLQNAPNPFNPATFIQYELPRPVRVRIDVFNTAGRLVRTLVDEDQEPGYKAVRWDGTNGRGERVSSGVYLYSMKAGDFVARKMMILLK